MVFAAIYCWSSTYVFTDSGTLDGLLTYLADTPGATQNTAHNAFLEGRFSMKESK